MISHEGLTRIHSQKKPRLHFGALRECGDMAVTVSMVSRNRQYVHKHLCELHGHQTACNPVLAACSSVLRPPLIGSQMHPQRFLGVFTAALVGCMLTSYTNMVWGLNTRILRLFHDFTSRWYHKPLLS